MWRAADSGVWLIVGELLQKKALKFRVRFLKFRRALHADPTEFSYDDRTEAFIDN